MYPLALPTAIVTIGFPSEFGNLGYTKGKYEEEEKEALAEEKS